MAGLRIQEAASHRLVVPSLPHHVTQRGNGRAQTLFGDEDYALYRDLLADSCHAAAVEVWAWVLMPSNPRAVGCGRATACLGPGASPLCRSGACAAEAHLLLPSVP